MTARQVRRRTAAMAALLVGAIPVAQGLAAQTLAPVDAREAARFDNVARASAQAGYSGPLVVGHGSGAADPLFVLLATRDGRGVLVGVAEPGASSGLRSVELEHGDTPAQIAVHGVHVSGFLNLASLYDLVVTHEPFAVEASTRFDTHYVLRRQNGTLEVACEFPGDASSGQSNQAGPMTTTRHVTVERVPRATTLTFAVHTIEALMNRGAPPLAGRAPPTSETIRQYELPAMATCKER